jgi:hypothetical protein
MAKSEGSLKLAMLTANVLDDLEDDMCSALAVRIRTQGAFNAAGRYEVSGLSKRQRKLVATAFEAVCDELPTFGLGEQGFSFDDAMLIATSRSHGWVRR